MIGYILKLIRIANNNLTIKEAADKLGVSQAYVSSIESGNKKPSLNTITKFATAYDISPSRIVLFDEIQTQTGLSYQETLKMVLDYYVLGKYTGDPEEIKKDYPKEGNQGLTR